MATQHATKVFSYVSWTLFGDRQCYNFCNQPIPIGESQFEHTSLNHLSDTAIPSLQELSDPDLFESAIDSFFDIGYKLYCLRV